VCGVDTHEVVQDLQALVQFEGRASKFQCCPYLRSVSGASYSLLNQKDRHAAASPEDNPDTSKVCGVIYRNA
jgi:hypothetical protein